MEIVRMAGQGAEGALAERIARELAGGRVLWLVCGGSNVPIAVSVMEETRKAVSQAELQNLTVALTDERYGPVGHADSNWQQLLDAGFNTEGIKTIPVLTGKPLEETVNDYAAHLAHTWEGAFILAQLGVGADGHIMGVLPHTEGIKDVRRVYAYEAPPYTRVTLSLSALAQASVAFALVFGASKHAVVERLMTEDAPLEEMPAQVLKRVPEAYLYTDQG